MKLESVVKIGGLIKREGWSDYAEIEQVLHSLTKEDVLASDWQVKPESVSFKCKWMVVDGSPVYPHNPGLDLRDLLEQFKYYETKVTIEVIVG